MKTHKEFEEALKYNEASKTGSFGQVIDKEVAVTVRKCKCGNLHKIPIGCSCGRVIEL